MLENNQSLKFRSSCAIAGEGSFFTFREISEIAAKLKANYQHMVLFKLMYAFGLTISELINLRVKNIDLEKKLIFINSVRKNNPRILNIPVDMVQILRAEACQRIGEELLFTGRNGKLHPRTVQKIFEKARSLTGKKITVNILRRSTAAHLKMQGWNDQAIKEYLGHSNTRSTRKLMGEAARLRQRKVIELKEINNTAA